jgi:hypothetical protein
MPSEKESVVRGEPGPVGPAGSDGNPFGVAVLVFLDRYRTEGLGHFGFLWFELGC